MLGQHLQAQKSDAHFLFASLLGWAFGFCAAPERGMWRRTSSG